MTLAINIPGLTSLFNAITKWIECIGKNTARVQGMQMQMQVQEQNQWFVEEKTGTSTIFIIYGLSAFLTLLLF